jgi:monothiol glutaredoxin
MPLSDKTKQRIESLIGSDKVVVFMKGNRRAPQCGFSAQVVQMLDSQLPSYTTVDVLQDPEVRQGIKDFTNWPTIPQVYVNGEFVGGCDILTELYQSGELEGLLGGAGS